MSANLKEKIDAMSYRDLLAHWRFAPIGHILFQGDSGDYIRNRMAELRTGAGGAEAHVAASKGLGW